MSCNQFHPVYLGNKSRKTNVFIKRILVEKLQLTPKLDILTENENETITIYTSNRFSIPRLQTEVTEIPFMHQNYRVASRFSWQDLKMEIEINDKLVELVRDYYHKKEFEIILIDSEGIVLSKWFLNGCFITNCTFLPDETYYKKAEISITFDRAVLLQ